VAAAEEQRERVVALSDRARLAAARLRVGRFLTERVRLAAPAADSLRS
jgi:hypothetical protein